MRKFLATTLTIATVVTPFLCGTAAAVPEETAEQCEHRLQWWREARFGMFMHWGLYALPAGEWKGMEKQKDLWGEWIMERAHIPVKEYEQLAKQFNPVKFNAEEWARVIHQAGMKYLVITAKHCDGFAMFKSQASRYNIVDATPFARDPMTDLAAALPKEGVKLGFYYSHCWDWHEPDALGHDNTWDFPDRKNKQVDRYLHGKSMPQIRELVTQYHPSLMWFDVPSDITRTQSAEIVSIIRSAVPNCIINDRVGNKLGDYSTPEQYIPRRAPGKDFEVCMTLNGHWGFDKNDHAWKPSSKVIAMLAEIAGKGGNLLLNVGPTAEGQIPEPALKILSEVGLWLNKNGVSIYGTQAGPLPDCSWGWCTTKPGVLYLHVLRWPANGQILVPGLKSDVSEAALLSDGSAKLHTERVGERDWIVKLPPQAPDSADSVVMLKLKGDAATDSTFVVDPIAGATTRLGCADAEIHGKGLKRTNLSLHDTQYDHIKSWTNQQASLEWKFRTPLAATYNVTVTYSAADDSVGNTFSFRIGDQELIGTVKATGGAGTFKTFDLGKISVPQMDGGNANLKATSIAGKSALMQFHAITLKAAKD